LHLSESLFSRKKAQKHKDIFCAFCASLWLYLINDANVVLDARIDFEVAGKLTAESRDLDGLALAQAAHAFLTVNPLNYVEWGEALELCVIKLGNVRIGDDFEPVILVEQVVH
jgi:hypothetical protein